MSTDASAVLFIDRFVSATSADDARSSLEQILDGLTANQIPVSSLIDDQEFLQSLLELLFSGRHKQSVPVEEGPTLVCRILLQVLSQQQKSREGPSLLTLPVPGRLMETLLDVATAASNDDGMLEPSTYTRVLALQLLMKLCQMHGSMAQTQLMQAPEGLHRLAELLSPATDDQVRNEALLLAKVVSKWPSCAKLWIFEEVGDTVMNLALAEGGLTNGNVLVLDCLEILANLYKHEASSAELAWQSTVIAPSLARLLDLRTGINFKNPTNNNTAAAKPQRSQLNDDDDDDDDLDAILNSATSNKLKEEVEPAVYIPRLTEPEEKIVLTVLDVFAVILDSERYRKNVWKIHAPLCTLVWELALFGPPPPNVNYMCATPSPHLQQKAMETVSTYFADPETMNRLQGLDRLLFQVCTGHGGSSAKEWKDRMGLSQAALHVIRQTLTTEAARELVLFSLAPPMTEDLSGPPPPTVVLKLLNTVAQNLQLEELRNDETRRISLIGALGALSLFVVDDTSREMMLRLTSGPGTPSLIDGLLESLAGLDNHENDGDIIASILRFLCEWMMSTPPVVQAVLSSAQSTAFGVLAASPHKIASTLTILVLGIAMEFMGDEEKCGGWTRSSLMEIMGKKNGGVSANTTLLEQFKTYKTDLPWAECSLEWLVWSSWYSNQVLVVRRRFVQELTGGAEQGQEEHGDDVHEELAPSDGRAKVKSLQSLVSQQSQELEDLRQSLSKAMSTIDSQQSELEVWKRRAESNPTQVDDILNEFKSKNVELESTIESLKADLVSQQNEFQAQLQEKDNNTAALQSELAESRERERETSEERDSLREELVGVTSAYNNLEEEFQRLSTMSATAAPTGEEGHDASREAQQPQGEGSEQLPAAGSGSTEVSALRADNTRLRNDIQAAEEWMAMAVQRMDGFVKQIATNDQELQSLRSQLLQARDDQSSQTNEVQQKLQSEHEASQQLREQLGTLVERIHFFVENEHGNNDSQDARQRSEINVLSALGALETLQLQRNDLIRKLQGATKELVDMRELAGRESAELKQRLQGEKEKVSYLENELSQKHREWEALVASKDEEIQRYNDEVNRLQRQIEESSSSLTEAQTLTATIAALEQQLKAAQDEAARIRDKEQAEIYQREARIRELEARLGHPQGRFTLDDIQSRDDAIMELRAANDAAQEWMGKAVEQHQILSDKMAALAEQNAKLTKQLRESQAQVTSLTNESLRIQELERRSRDLDEITTQLTASKVAIAEKEIAIDQLEAEIKTLRGQLQQARWAEEEIASANSQITELQAQVEASEQERDDSMRLLESELEVANARISELENNQTNPLLDGSAMDSDHRVQELERALASVEKSLRSATESEHALRKELEINRLELEKKSAELSSAVSDVEKHYHQTLILTEMVDKFEAERKKLGGQGESTTHDAKSLAVRVLELEQAALESQQLLAQLQEAKADLRRDEDIVHQWEERVAELEATIGDLEKQLVDQETEASNVISLWQDSCATFEKENIQLKADVEAGEDAKRRTEELESRMQERETELNEVVSKWQKRCAEFENENVQMKNEISKYLERTSELEAAVIELKRQVGEKDTEMDKATSRWQETYAAMESENTRLKDGVAQVVVAQERQAELEAAVSDLEQQLVEQENEASMVIAQWEARCEAFEAEIVQFKEQADAFEALKATAEQLQTRMNNQEMEASNAISRLQERCALTEESNAKLTDEANVWKSRIVELEAAVNGLESKLFEQEKETREAIAQWERSCRGFEKENAELREEIATMSSADMLADLEATVKELEGRLVEQENEANAALSQWEERCLALENEIAQLTDEISTLRSTDKIEELIANVKELETQLAEQENEANMALSQWEARCSVFESENVQLKEQITSLQSRQQPALLETTLKMEAQLTEKENAMNEKISQLQAMCSDFKNEISRAKEEVASAVTVKEELLIAKAALERKVGEQEQEHRSEMSDWQSKLDTLESKRIELEQSLKVAVHDKEVLLKGVERVKAKIISLESDCEEKDRMIANLGKRIEGGAETVAAEKHALAGELESQKQQAEALRLEMSQLKDASAKWQERCLTAEKAVDDLKITLDFQKDESKALEEKLTLDKERLESILGELNEKEKLIESTRQELEQERSTRDVTSSQVDVSVPRSSVHEEVSTLKAAIESLTTESEDAVNQWKDRVEELESLVGELEDQLDQANSAANEAISCWEARYEELGNALAESERSGHESVAKILTLGVSELQEKDEFLIKLGKNPALRDPVPDFFNFLDSSEAIDSFTEKLKAELQRSNVAVKQAIEEELTARSLKFDHKSSQKDLDAERESMQATTTLLEEKTQELQTILEQKDSTIATLDVDATIFKRKIQELEAELRNAREDVESEKRNQVDAKSVCEALQAVHAQERSSLEATIGTEAARRTDLERKLEEQKRKLDKLEHEVAEYQSRADMLQIERGRIEDALTKEKILENEQIETWRQECDSLKKEVEMERDRWSAIVSQLEEELRQANDTLQTYYTDEVSERATAAAAEALEAQVDEMQMKLHDCRLELVKEQNARQVIEKEAARLKSDLATLLAMDGNEVNDVDLVAFKATDRIQRKEREEIDELRKALALSQQDLASLRATSSDAEDRTAKARLQASICEQELISAKSDLKFLAQTMEEMREAEESRRASLEYRINALEDDHEVLRRFHADEVESLRNDLTQVSLEKDRILHSLKESEKALNALMFASSQGGEEDGSVTSPKAELMKLRIEKEQMLAAAAEEASNIEKRIREAIGAHAASLEADVILERELRIAAEAALDNTRAEIAELREALARSPSKSFSPSPGKSVDNLKSELQRCSQEIQKLADENSSLRTELDRANADAKATINKLTEQYRKAQARAHKLECDSRSESEVKSEVTRLRIEERDDDAWHSPRSNGHNPANDYGDDDDDDHLPTSKKALDMLKQQKVAIHEERQLYLELLAEHDDLLALVAQQDIERETLQEALLQAVGQEAVDEAFKTAEEKALAQFGKHVKLSQE